MSFLAMDEPRALFRSELVLSYGAAAESWRFVGRRGTSLCQPTAIKFQNLLCDYDKCGVLLLFRCYHFDKGDFWDWIMKI